MVSPEHCGNVFGETPNTAGEDARAPRKRGRAESLLAQAEEQTRGRRRDIEEMIRAVIGNAAARRPIGRAQIRILLQRPAGRGIRPGNGQAVA